MGDKCIECGKPLKNKKFNRCNQCEMKWRERQGGGHQGRGGGAFSGLPDGYLKDGYFDQEGVIFPYLVTDTASQVARAFTGKLKNHQLRRFYQHAKAVENRLKSKEPWPSLLPEIQKLKAFGAEAKGKGKITPAFFDFLEKNLSLVENEESFSKGFIVHFEAVVAYYTYHFPRA